jgi:hypothetical protein
MKKLFIVFALLLVGRSHDLFGYSAIPTHEAITKKAVEVSKIKQYLQDNIQIDPEDFDNIYKQQIINGSNFEDDDTRPINHFHNPITNQGLSDVFNGLSAREWINDPSNNWSWKQTRDYYYQSMTVTTEELRRGLFAQSFEGLGHAVHLIQDMSVPEHVRNDQHIITQIPIIGWNEYEPWVRSTIDPLSFNASPFSFPPNFPLKNFWDADTYADSPVQQTDLIGLAEYTSYNFLSQDAIFTEDRPKSDPHYFPHPRKEFTNAVLIEQIAEDGDRDQVYYVHGYQTNRLAAYSYFNRYLLPFDAFGEWRYHFDTLVYEEYAGRLIPKAISYSAGLLNYFFRGELDAQADGNDGIRITNNSNEVMEGTFALFYDTIMGERSQVVNASWHLQIAPGDQSQPQTFIVPTDAKEIGKYILVFRGRLGLEENAVVGRVVAACEGLCEDWEGTSAHYFTNQLDFPHFESGSNTFQTKNGTGEIQCPGFSFEGAVDIKQDIGTNHTNALSVYIKAHADPFYNNSQCGATLTLKEPLLLAKYHHLRVDFYYSPPELIAFSPFATLHPQINFFVIYFDQPIVPPFGQFYLTYLLEYTTAPDLNGVALWKTFDADIFDTIDPLLSQMSGAKIIRIDMVGRFEFGVCLCNAGSTAARTFGWDNIRIFADQ